jgi:hypothetical protein
MKILVLIVSALLVPIFHNLLLGWLPYRWLVNSMLYPYHRYFIWRKFRRFTPKQRRNYGTAFVNKANWSKRFWFGRAIDNHVCKKYIEPYL